MRRHPSVACQLLLAMLLAQQRFGAAVHLRLASEAETAAGVEALRAAQDRCSLEQHAAADVALLGAAAKSPLADAECGGFPLDAAPRGTAFVSIAAGGAKVHRKAKGSRGFLRLRPRRAKRAQRVVWISGFPRSATSTVLSMVSAGQTAASESPQALLKKRGKTQQQHTFSLFEPCHDGDEYSTSLRKGGCDVVLRSLAKCDFSGVRKLWGWSDKHSSPGARVYSPDLARSLCSNADVIAFKTVDHGHRLTKWRGLLDATPGLRVLDVVRDPRGIYASWLSLEPFATLVRQGRYYTVEDICSAYAENLDFNDTRVHRVVFERMVADPARTLRVIYDFLGLPLADAPKAWVDRTFNAVACPEPKPWEVGFTDCHTNSKEMAAKWRSVLSKEDIARVDNNADCQRVIKHYGYPST
eukprot:TRINITY_DN37668_c0_g1_i1.p1 TRINITY_DN37668_c0_g1~~TRINITY_DN37668_c0_g1_i1.p1  ORF type:complete len:413 (-),score=89.42 TRINITY_DN37668_c0_g1_i1:92-1330(-)